MPTAAAVPELFALRTVIVWFAQFRPEEPVEPLISIVNGVHELKSWEALMDTLGTGIVVGGETRSTRTVAGDDCVQDPSLGHAVRMLAAAINEIESPTESTALESRYINTWFAVDHAHVARDTPVKLNSDEHKTLLDCQPPLSVSTSKLATTSEPVESNRNDCSTGAGGGEAALSTVS